MADSPGTNSKIVGTLTGADPAIGGVYYECSKLTAKWEQKKIEYEAMGSQWVHSIPSGVLKVSGSFEMAADNNLLGGTYPAPFSISYVTFSVPVGSKTLSMSCVVSDVEIDASPDLYTIKGNYQSDSTVTWS